MNYVDHTIVESVEKPYSPDRQRVRLLWFVTWIIAFTLLGRSFYLQVVHGANYLSEAERNRVAVVVEPAPRGIIYDRTGKQLVENVSSTDLILDPSLLPTEENEAYLLENLPRLVPDLTAEFVQDALHKARSTQQPVLLAKALSHELVLSLGEAGEQINGTRLASSLVRKYSHSHMLAHILGYTSAVTAQELQHDDSLYPTDITGKLGIEQFYNDELKGEHGTSYTEVNAVGRPQIDLGQKNSIPGEDLSLTIDVDFQDFIFSVLAERDQTYRDERGEGLAGSVVALNPQNGEVMALVNYPSFDPNTFSQPSLRGESATYFTDERRPLFNRAVDGTYPSGSTIKPFLAAGALEEGVITEDTTIFSSGGISVGPWNFPDWKTGGHGVTDVKKAIAESVNTFFYAISGGYENINGLGVSKTSQYLSDFGWGSATGIDLASEATGFLPTKEWKENVKGEPWYIGDTYHYGIGQGDVLVTPLQVAVATGGIAEGRYIYEPHLVRKEIEKSEIGISRTNTAIVQMGMRQTVTDGSGRQLSSLPIPLAGKTGTAQVGGTDKTHAWFTSYGPFEHPELVVTVLLEHGGAGDVDAVPVAHDIWAWWSEHQE